MQLEQMKHALPDDARTSTLTNSDLTWQAAFAGAYHPPTKRRQYALTRLIAYQTNTSEVNPVKKSDVSQVVQLVLFAMQPSWTMPRYWARNLNPLAMASQT